MQRLDWTNRNIDRRKLDLSTNVHYDSILNQEIRNILSEYSTFNNYPYQVDLYDAISAHYDIPIERLAVGYGATEMLERIFKSLDFDIAYVVEPSFQMMEVYCHFYNKQYIPISADDLDTLVPLQNSILAIANPNGNNGEIHDISSFIDKFKYVLSDEVYADFNSYFSLLKYQIPNVLVVKSFSKSLGLAGFRCGFAVSSKAIIKQLQDIRSNFIMNTFSSIVIPRVIHMTDDVVIRMKHTKRYLETMYECKQSNGNYVLFKNVNKYTEVFGSKYIDGFYRMALTDIGVLNDYKSY